MRVGRVAAAVGWSIECSLLFAAILCAVLALAPANAFAASAWASVPCSYTLNEVAYPDSVHAWAVGYETGTDDGVIMNTTDGGRSWATESQTKPLNAVSFPDSNHGWAVGDDGVILNMTRTQAGDSLWTPQEWDMRWQGETPYRVKLTDVHFADEFHGWAVGLEWVSRWWVSYEYIVVIKTDDGGKTWTQKTANSGNVAVGTASIDCIDGDHAWVVINGAVIVTDDGGSTWRWGIPNISGLKGYGLRSAHFENASHGWVVGWASYSDGRAGRGAVFVTDDGGLTWRIQADGLATSVLKSVSFSDARHGVAVGDRGAQFSGESCIWTTSDGGEHWTPQSSPSPEIDAYLESVSSPDADHACAAGGSRLFFYGDGDVVPVVVGNPSTKKPVLILVAGLDSDTGEHLVKPSWPWESWETKNPGPDDAPWDYIKLHANGLGVHDILVMPTTQNSREWPAEKDNASHVIDSKGALDYNIWELAGWLNSPEVRDRIGDHPVILLGHSYGGLIARSALAVGAVHASGDGGSIIGLIQYGTPNGGSGSADYANSTGFDKSDATLSMATGTMRERNSSNGTGRLKVPIVRFGGTYLPDALGIMTGEHDPARALLLNGTHHGKPSDGMVEAESLQDGFRQLDDADFGDGAWYLDDFLTHARDMPGTRNLYLKNGKQVQELVPWGDEAALLPKLKGLIADMDSGRVGRSAPNRLKAAAAEESSLPQASPALPPRTVVVSADTAAGVTITLDGSACLLLSSAVGTATAVVRDGADRVVHTLSSSDSDAGGVVTTAIALEVAAPGEFTIDITLPSGVSGNVTLAGAIAGGAQYTLSAPEHVYVGAATLLTARFVSAAGIPLLGATLVGSADLGGENKVDLAFSDGGTDADAVAGDGIYTAEFAAPISGRWLVRAAIRHPSAERVSSVVVDVGTQAATVTGPILETTEQGPGGTLASFGVRVPVHVSDEGTYTVRGNLTDSLGAQVGVLTTVAHLAANESTTLVAALDSSHFSGIAEGELTVSPLHITRYTDGIDLDAGSGPGLTTSRSYAKTDFYAFSVALFGPTANPSPTSAVHFTGTALNTSSTVAAVEYSLDGSATWHPVASDDGIFDSHSEDFEIDLDLPDYVYGILVRQTGADGTQLPVADWGGKRFTIDTVAPAQAAGFAVSVTTGTGSPVAHASWLPSDPLSDTVSPVRYSVTLDGIDIGTTYGTSLDIPLPDTRSHSLALTPIDGAGNTGPVSRASVDGIPSSDETPPATTVQVLPLGNTAGWNNTNALVSLTATDGSGGGGVAHIDYQLDSEAPERYAGAFQISVEGVHTLLFSSTDAVGNSEVTQTVTVRIDKTAPSTTDDHQAVYTSSATVHLTPSDALSGVAATTWTLDGVAGSGSTVTTSVLGTHTFKFRSTDVAGNAEDTTTVTFTVAAPPRVATGLKLTSASSVKRKKTLTATAAVSPTAAPGTVKFVFQRKVGKKWRSVKSATVGLSGGKAVYKYKPGAKGTWRFVATYSGKETASAVYLTSSAARGFKVK